MVKTKYNIHIQNWERNKFPNGEESNQAQEIEQAKRVARITETTSGSTLLVSPSPIRQRQKQGVCAILGEHGYPFTRQASGSSYQLYMFSRLKNGV